jgi:hypothetical protein
MEWTGIYSFDEKVEGASHDLASCVMTPNTM